MNDINAVAAGRIEDKWVEFVVAEFAARPRNASRQARAVTCIKRVEVQVSYLWLFAGALVALWLS
jgi:hypothetical protein